MVAFVRPMSIFLNQHLKSYGAPHRSSTSEGTTPKSKFAFILP